MALILTATALFFVYQKYGAITVWGSLVAGLAPTIRLGTWGLFTQLSRRLTFS